MEHLKKLGNAFYYPTASLAPPVLLVGSREQERFVQSSYF